MRRLYILISFIFLCAIISSCKNKIISIKEFEQINNFYNKNGVDYISQKDLLAIVRKAKNICGGEIVNISIDLKVPPVPARKCGIGIQFSAILQEKSEIRKFVYFEHFKNNLNTYIGRKMVLNGKWYCIYENSREITLEGRKLEWKTYGVYEYEFYKIIFDDGTIVYHRAYKGLTYEKVRGILLFLKESNFAFKVSDITKTENGYDVRIPNENDPYEGVWLKIYETEDTFKVIEQGGYVK